MLPLVLLVNEDILAERRQLWSIRFKLKRGDSVPAEQRIRLRVVADRYATKVDDLHELGRRVDVVPPSIILAAAGEELKREQALETARKAARRERSVGAALGAAGDRPSSKHAMGEMPNKTALSLARSPLEFIRALVHALNTLPAYESFRPARAEMRLAGQPLDALRLAAALPSHRGSQLHGEHITALIMARRLDRFDAARLQPTSPSG